MTYKPLPFAAALALGLCLALAGAALAAMPTPVNGQITDAVTQAYIKANSLSVTVANETPFVVGATLQDTAGGEPLRAKLEPEASRTMTLTYSQDADMSGKEAKLMVDAGGGETAAQLMLRCTKGKGCAWKAMIKESNGNFNLSAEEVAD